MRNSICATDAAQKYAMYLRGCYKNTLREGGDALLPGAVGARGAAHAVGNNDGAAAELAAVHDREDDG
jgi:hypothetical protein